MHKHSQRNRYLAIGFFLGLATLGGWYLVSRSSSSYAAVATIDKQIVASADDAYENSACCWPPYSHSSATIYAGRPGGAGFTVGGWRWTGLNIPAGAAITEAYVEFSQQGYGTVASSILAFENSANPATFSSSSSPLSRWSQRTTFSQQWIWSQGQPGAWVRTSSLKDGIQELVNAYGAIDAVALLEEGSLFAQGQGHTWDSYDAGVAKGAKLHIEYATGGAPVSTPTPTPTSVSTPTPTPIVAPTPAPVSSPGVTIESYYPQKPSAPAGRFPVIQDLNIGESYTYTLVGGATRTVTLVSTRKVASGFSTNATLWATATVRVSGSGVATAEAEIPAAFFQAPRIINDVRVIVDVTRDFNDNTFGDRGQYLGNISKDAKLLISDGRYTMTNLATYRYPVPSQLWHEGFNVTHHLALQAINEHHPGFDMGMPKGTNIYAWIGGTVSRGDNGDAGRNVTLVNADDGRSQEQHRALHFDRVDTALDGTRVEKGTFLGTSGEANWPHIHWSSGGPETGLWDALLAEWYVAQNDPIKLSYIKDWLVIGPFDGAIGDTQIANEATVQPAEGGTSSGKQWKKWDNLVPGVVMVREAIDPYPYSGRAAVSEDHLNKIAYLAAYVYSPSQRQTVLRIGKSDPIKVWWNGSLVASDNAYKVISGASVSAMDLDKFTPTVSLNAGWNTVIVKTRSEGTSNPDLDWERDSWNLAVRISDSAGNPIPGLQFSISGSGIPVPTPSPIPAPTPSPSILWPPKPDGTDRVPFSQNPPGGLQPNQVPQFITFGIDDATDAYTVNWFANELFGPKFNSAGSGNSATFDGLPARGTFNAIGNSEGCGQAIGQALNNAYLRGNEIGNHAYTDGDRGLTATGWRDVITKTNEFLARPVEGDGVAVDTGCGPKPRSGAGIPFEHIYGFRTPGDAYNEALFPVLQDPAIKLYHSSSVQGYGYTGQGFNGTNLYWPGTLDNGTPYDRVGHQITGKYPGLWEIPQQHMMLPPSIKQKYGFEGDRVGYCDGAWIYADAAKTKPIDPADTVGILKYNLDLQYDNNRAPMSLCVHANWAYEAGTKQWFQDFLNYALSKPDVRVVRQIDVINWMKNPVALGSASIPTPTPLPTPTPTSPPSTKFTIGDRVQVIANSLNVRSTPSTTGTLLGTHVPGDQGLVVLGPQSANGYNWWQINYDTEADGWSAEGSGAQDWLAKITTPVPIPIPTPGASLVLYDDGLKNGYQLNSWGTVVPNPSYTSTPYGSGDNGPAALFHNLYTQGGGTGEHMFLYGTKFNTGDYTHITFWARTTRSGGAKMRVAFAANSYAQEGGSKQFIIDTVPTSWTRFEIPVDQIALSNMSVAGIVFIGGSGDASYAYINPNEILLDDIKMAVIPDTTPPVLQSASGRGLDTVNVVFNEKINSADAGVFANYRLSSSDDVAYNAAKTPVEAILSATGKEVSLRFPVFMTSGKNYTLTVNNIRDIFGNAITPNSRASFLVSVQPVSMTVNAAKAIAPITPKNRGTQLTAWTYAWGANPNEVPGLIDVLRPLKIGIFRYGGGLWANGMNWTRTGREEDSNGHTLTPSLVNDLNDFANQLNADIMMQINICDNDPAKWADMVRYVRVENNYPHLKYWEVGNENDLEGCTLGATKETARDAYAQRFPLYHQALKAVDTTIKVMGPVPTQLYRTDWLDALYGTMGNALDVMSWHWYPLTSAITTDPANPEYHSGSIEALFSYNTVVGERCVSWLGGCAGATITQDNQWRRRIGAESIMNYVKQNFKSKNPNLETAITEFGVHCCDHDHPMNGNHVGALWAADMLARLAYNGLDTLIFYDLDTGGNAGRSILDGAGSGGAIRPRSLYNTLFMYAQYFGDMMVESSTSDPRQDIVVWASTDSKDPGTLKLMLVNFKNTVVQASVNIQGFAPKSGKAYEMTNPNPLDMSVASRDNPQTTINGYKIANWDPANPQAFANSIAAIAPKTFAVSGNTVSYAVPPYSAVALVLSTTGSPAPTPQPTPTLPIPTITSVDTPHLFSDKSSGETLRIRGTNFTLNTDFTLRILQGGVVKATITLQPKDTTTIETTITPSHIGSLIPGSYTLELIRVSDNASISMPQQSAILITKLGDVWGSSGTRDGKIDIYDVSRFLSKWKSILSSDIFEFDINPGPNNVSLNKIDIYDINKMMSNWTR